MFCRCLGLLHALEMLLTAYRLDSGDNTDEDRTGPVFSWGSGGGGGGGMSLHEIQLLFLMVDSRESYEPHFYSH